MAIEKPLTKASDYPPEVLGLFDKYVHGAIDRRAFLREAAKYAVGTLTAVGILDALSPKFAQAQKVALTDPRITTEYIEIPSPKGYGKVRGYLVKPVKDVVLKDAPKAAVVLVVHENRGLNPHIEDIARRVALEGFIAFAPDALSPLGGYPGDEDAARELFKKLDQAKTREDFLAAADYAKGIAGSNGKLGVVGFCYGGAIVNFLATRLPDLRAAVPFYGTAPDAADVPKIKSALQIHFAGVDERVNATWPAYEAALKAAKIKYEAFTYAGAQHGSTTIPRRATTKRRQNWPGDGPSHCSSRHCGRKKSRSAIPPSELAAPISGRYQF